MSIVAGIIIGLLMIAVIIALFTGQLTVEQLVAVALAALLANGVIEETRLWWKKRKEDKTEES